MSNLVTNYSSYSPEVHSRICFKTKERCLQNSGREHDFVIERIVVRIDCLWSHFPLGFIHRLTYLIQLFLVSPLGHLNQVFKKRSICRERHLRIVLPLVRVTYFYFESAELMECFFLGSIAHPSHILDMLCETFLKIIHQSNHFFFGLGWEIFLYIEFTESLSYYPIDKRKCTLVHRALLLLSVEVFAIEVKRKFVQSSI